MKDLHKVKEERDNYFRRVWNTAAKDNRKFKVPPVQTCNWNDADWGWYVANSEEIEEAKRRGLL